MQENIQFSDLLEEYINDVVERNKRMTAYRDSLMDEYKSMSLEEIKSRLKSVWDEDRVYRGVSDDDRDPGNDFELFEENASWAIAEIYFGDTENVKKIIGAYVEERASLQGRDTLSENEKKSKMKIMKIRFNNKLKDVYRTNYAEIKEKGYDVEYYSKILADKETEFKNRQVVQKEFNINKSNDDIVVFDEELDKGCCTKSLTVSLYKLQEKYGLNIFGKLNDVEDIAHPKSLTQKLNKYMKRSESGNLEDIEIKRGDIVFLTRDDGVPQHAMLCYDVDKKTNEPMLMGFSAIQNNVKAKKNYYGESRKGMVLDVNSLIKDSCKGVDKTNYVQPCSRSACR